MRRLQKAAVLAIAVGSLSGMGAGVSAAEPAAPVSAQGVSQAPTAPTQYAVQQIGSSMNAPQQTTLQQAAPQQTLAQAAPQQATTSQAPVQQNTPTQATVQGVGHAILPAAVRPAPQNNTPQTVTQSALQTSPQTVLRTSPQAVPETAAQASAPQVVVNPQTGRQVVAQLTPNAPVTVE